MRSTEDKGSGDTMGGGVKGEEAKPAPSNTNIKNASTSATNDDSNSNIVHWRTGIFNSGGSRGSGDGGSGRGSGDGGSRGGGGGSARSSTASTTNDDNTAHRSSVSGVNKYHSANINMRNFGGGGGGGGGGRHLVDQAGRLFSFPF